MAKKLQITWVKSAIGYSRGQKETIRALGFKRLGESLVKEDCPVIQGMVEKVRHLLEIEGVGDEGS